MLPRVSRRLAALLGLSAVWLLLLCAPALAHARLVETYPAEGATLIEPPEQVQLLFSEPVEAEFDPVEVYDQDGKRVDQGNARVSPNNAKLVVTDLKELLEGSYTVEWRVTSPDGHPISGESAFVVNPSANGADENPGEPIEPVERPSEQEDPGSGQNLVLGLALGVLLIGALAAAGLVMLRRRKGAP